MSTHKKISKTIEVSCNLKLHQFDDGSFDIFFRGSPGGYYFTFSANHKLLHSVHKCAYGRGRPETNEKNNWRNLKERLYRESQTKELPSVLKKYLRWKFEAHYQTSYIEKRLGCIVYFKEQD
tara:strand:+ start:316 stop:681 length:366 start_codon:yes stop_codon:yes gene_type:complete